MTGLGAAIAFGFAGAGAAAFVPARIAALVGAVIAAIAFALILGHAASDGAATIQPFGGVSALGISGGLRLDGLSLVFALLITGIGALILLYAHAYHRWPGNVRELRNRIERAVAMAEGPVLTAADVFPEKVLSVRPASLDNSTLEDAAHEAIKQRVR